MTLQEIQELAGHREVSPWVVKLVGDAVAKEREEVLDLVDAYAKNNADLANAIRARGNQ